MRATNSQNEINAIVAALSKIHVRPFTCKSCDPKYDAQRNLSGKTHYVDDDTLRFHKSRILSAERLHGGLLYRIVCSDALDMHNTCRGFRAVVFDVFGTVIERPELEDAHHTSKAAIKHNDALEIDLMAHYRAAIEAQIQCHQRELDGLRDALELLPREPAIA